jgi:hypothetical protein
MWPTPSAKPVIGSRCIKSKYKKGSRESGPANLFHLLGSVVELNLIHQLGRGFLKLGNLGHV